MPVVVMMETSGDTEQLLAAADDLGRKAGRADGLLARVVAPTSEGILLVHIWASDQARAAWQENPKHRTALIASGMPALAISRTVREYVTDRVELFAPTGRGA